MTRPAHEFGYEDFGGHETLPRVTVQTSMMTLAEAAGRAAYNEAVSCLRARQEPLTQLSAFIQWRDANLTSVHAPYAGNAEDAFYAGWDDEAAECEESHRHLWREWLTLDAQID